MNFCPKNANMFGEHQETHEALAEWCRHVYQSGSDRCMQCELRAKFGVGVERAKDKKSGIGPVQGRLF